MLPLPLPLDARNRISRPTVGSVSPRPDQHGDMIVPFALLHEELDLDLGPEALDALLAIPLADLELDAPGDAFPLLELGQGLLQAVRLRRVPAVDSAVGVGFGMELGGKEDLGEGATLRVAVGREWREEGQGAGEIGGGSAVEGIEHVAGDG